jgi:uncharacterized protein (DUF427 family)
VKIPGLHHPITIEPAAERVTVRAGGRVIADSTSALVLREAKLPPVYYVPLDDVDASAIARSSSISHCPYKGDASYYDVVTDTGTIGDAVWEYQHPYDAVGEIAGHVAFYPSRVQISTAEISAAS